MKPTIFILDDNCDFRFFATRAIELEDFHAQAFANAADLFAALEAANELPRLVFVDYFLTDITAQEFCTRLRARPAWSQIAIVLCSGIDSIQTKAVEIGADGYLKKPFDLDAIHAVLGRYGGETPG